MVFKAENYILYKSSVINIIYYGICKMCHFIIIEENFYFVTCYLLNISIITKILMINFDLLLMNMLILVHIIIYV